MIVWPRNFFREESRLHRSQTQAEIFRKEQILASHCTAQWPDCNCDPIVKMDKFLSPSSKIESNCLFSFLRPRNLISWHFKKRPKQEEHLDLRARRQIFERALCTWYYLPTVGRRQRGRRRVKFVLLDVQQFRHPARFRRGLYEEGNGRNETLQHLLSMGIHIFGLSSRAFLHTSMFMAHHGGRTNVIYR